MYPYVPVDLNLAREANPRTNPRTVYEYYLIVPYGRRDRYARTPGRGCTAVSVQLEAPGLPPRGAGKAEQQPPPPPPPLLLRIGDVGAATVRVSKCGLGGPQGFQGQQPGAPPVTRRSACLTLLACLSLFSSSQSFLAPLPFFSLR
eukprot:SAG31_NODE_12502_length_936_cov_4.758662_1_plen_145_part_10